MHAHHLAASDLLELATDLVQEARLAFGRHGGVPVFLDALRAMDSVRVVCEDPSPER